MVKPLFQAITLVVVLAMTGPVSEASPSWEASTPGVEIPHHDAVWGHFNSVIEFEKRFPGVGRALLAESTGADEAQVDELFNAARSMIEEYNAASIAIFKASCSGLSRDVSRDVLAYTFSENEHLENAERELQVQRFYDLLSPKQQQAFRSYVDERVRKDIFDRMCPDPTTHILSK